MPVDIDVRLRKPVSLDDLIYYLRSHPETSVISTEIVENIAACFFFGEDGEQEYSTSRRRSIQTALDIAFRALAGV